MTTMMTIACGTLVDICLEKFYCLPAEQSVALRRFLKFSNSNNILRQTFAAEVEKEQATGTL